MISIFLMVMQNNAVYAENQSEQFIPLQQFLVLDEPDTKDTQTSTLEALYRDLKNADANDHSKITGLIAQEWEKSGSVTLDFLYDTAQASANQGALTLAIDQITVAIEHGPDFTQAYVLRATFYIASGSYGPAISDLQTALSLESRHFEAIVLLAQIFEDTGNETRALALYEQVTALAPHHIVARARIGHLLYTQKGWPIMFSQGKISSNPSSPQH